MYIGRYDHKLEAKNRLSVPAKFRSTLVDGGVITKGLDGCLWIFDAVGWKKQLRVLEGLTSFKKAHRSIVRHLTNDANELEIDALGRIHISDPLKELGGLNKEVVFVGSYDRIEVWDRDRYHDYITRMEKDIEHQVEAVE